MSFENWLWDFNKARGEAVIHHYSKKGEGLKIERNKVLVPEGLDERTLQLFIAYKNQQTNKKLVWATWVLAIGTLILSGLTIYFGEF